MVKGYRLRKLSKSNAKTYECISFLYLIFMPIAMVYGILGGIIYYEHIYWLHIILMLILYIIARVMYEKGNQISNQPQQLKRKLQAQFLQGPFSQDDAEQLHKQQIKNQIQTQLEKTLSSFAPSEIRRIKNPNDRPQKLYCSYCKITIPYRARHCRDCNVCTLRYDHHCFWLGNCVGQRNHLHFYALAWAQFLHCIVSINYGYAMFDLLPWYLMWSAYFQIIVLLLLLLFTVFMVFIQFYLVLVNTILIGKGLTTWQVTRRSKISYLNYLNRGYNPFTKGCSKNFKSLLLQSWQQENGGEDWLLPTFGQAQDLFGDEWCTTF